MHNAAKFVFWITLALYGATLIFATYVGVYLTYVAIPMIVISGLIMKITKQKEKTDSGFLSAVNELGKTATSALEGVDGFLDDTNTSLKKFNRKQSLVRERTSTHREQIRRLKIKKIEPEINLKYAKNDEEKRVCKNTIEAIKSSIKEIEQKMLDIEKQCEIEVANSAG